MMAADPNQMRVDTPQMRWHIGDDNKNAPVQGVDFHPTESVLATAAADTNVHLWLVGSKKAAAPAPAQPASSSPEHGADAPPSATPAEGVERGLVVKFVFCLQGHQKAANAVRFSPNGECLASASDDGLVVVWYRNPSTTNRTNWSWGSIKSERELQRLQLRGHVDDVFDLAWAPDSRHLVSASIDHTAVVWNVPERTRVQTLRDHAHYVQGVAWDPRDKIVVTQSSDRTARVYARASAGARRKNKDKADDEPLDLQYTVSRRAFPRPEVAAMGEAVVVSSSGGGNGNGNGDGESKAPKPKALPKSHKMFYDDSVATSGRRGTFTPDGLLYLSAAGLFQAGPLDPQVPTLYGFARGVWNTPLFHMPLAPVSTVSAVSTAQQGEAGSSGGGGGRQKAEQKSKQQDCASVRSHVAVAVRCCPVLFRLKGDEDRVPATATAEGSAAAAAVTEDPQQRGAAAVEGTDAAAPAVVDADAEAAPASDAPAPMPTSFVDGVGEGEAEGQCMRYRVVFAVLTRDSVLMCDTQHAQPFAVVRNIHYAKLTDAAWSPRGDRLVVSSEDGYCSVLSFDARGRPVGLALPEQELPACVKQPKGPTFASSAVVLPDAQQAAPPPMAAVAAAPVAPAGAPVAGLAAEPAPASTPSASASANASASAAANADKKRRITPMLLQSDAPAPASTPSASANASASAAAGSTATANADKKKRITPLLLQSDAPTGAAATATSSSAAMMAVAPPRPVAAASTAAVAPGTGASVANAPAKKRRITPLLVQSTNAQ